MNSSARFIKSLKIEWLKLGKLMRVTGPLNVGSCLSLNVNENQLRIFTHFMWRKKEKLSKIVDTANKHFDAALKAFEAINEADPRLVNDEQIAELKMLRVEGEKTTAQLKEALSKENNK